MKEAYKNHIVIHTRDANICNEMDHLLNNSLTSSVWERLNVARVKSRSSNMRDWPDLRPIVTETYSYGICLMIAVCLNGGCCLQYFIQTYLHSHYILLLSYHLMCESIFSKQFSEPRLYLTKAPFYQHGWTVILAWISNHMPSKVWDEITYPFPKLQRCNRWSFGMDK